MRQETTTDEVDPYLWLEEIEGRKALDWVSNKNKKVLAEFQQHPLFQEIYRKSLEINNSSEKIPYPTIRGNYFYNFWQDEKNERGVLRRTTLHEYRKKSPKWEIVLDIDGLSRKENVKWVFNGTENLPPNYAYTLVKLSREGKDAIEIREFDYQKKQFVKNGFTLPEAKGGAWWLDEDTLIVATDFGEGTLTHSGYPRLVKLWKRGTKLDQAEMLFEGEAEDVFVGGHIIYTPERNYNLVIQRLTFYTGNFYVIEEGQLIHLDIPKDAIIKGIFKNQLIVHLKSNWDKDGRKFQQGTLISIDYDQLLLRKHQILVIEEPEDRSSLKEVSCKVNFLIIHKLTNVSSELISYQLIHQKWEKGLIPLEKKGSVFLWDSDSFTDNLLFVFTSFLVPTVLHYATAPDKKLETLKTTPDFFDSSPYKVEQFEANSKDGTLIPYFLVSAKELKLDSENPVLLNGYGGYEISQVPFYSGTIGVSWLEKGGVFVLANIRGGGEFGPKWHQAAVKEKRQYAFDDFIAVAEQLIEKKITSPKHLGIMGGSNGGLLVGAVLVQRPELFNAVVCQVPVLDLKRYHKLLAGSSWIAEMGNPDIPEEWEYLKKYSPYHNLSKDIKYPKVFFTTSTKDDRVHPGHARKMAAKMEDMKHSIFYYENTEGGHSAASTNSQRAFLNALTYSYLLRELAK